MPNLFHWATRNLMEIENNFTLQLQMRHAHTHTHTHARTRTCIYRTSVFMALGVPEQYVTPTWPNTTPFQHHALSGGALLCTRDTNTRSYYFQTVIIFQKRKLEVLLSGGKTCSFTQTCPLCLEQQRCKRTRNWGMQATAVLTIQMPLVTIHTFRYNIQQFYVLFRSVLRLSSGMSVQKSYREKVMKSKGSFFKLTPF
jgi:hypothetical protein